MPPRYMMQDTLTQSELDFPPVQIKRLTPELNNLLHPRTKKPIKLNLKERAFCWYYLYNSNNKAEAFRLAFHSKFNKKTNKMEATPPASVMERYNKAIQEGVKAGRCDDKGDQPNGRRLPEAQKVLDRWAKLLNRNAHSLWNKEYIAEAYLVLLEGYLKSIKKNLSQTLTEQMITQATYDPAMFISPDGSPAFTDWDEIPQKYHCCVEGIESKFYGKNADRKVVVIKLADRKQARQELFKTTDALVEGIREIKNKNPNLGKDISEFGISSGEFDPKSMSDSDLKSLYERMEQPNEDKQESAKDN